MSPQFPLPVSDQDFEVTVARYEREAVLPPEQIAAMGPAAFSAFVSGPESPASGDGLFQLGTELAAAVAADPEPWGHGFAEFAEVNPRLAYHAVLGFQKALNDAVPADWTVIADAIAAYLAVAPADPARYDVARAGCGLITQGVGGSPMKLPAAAYPAASRLVSAALGSADPSPESVAERAAQRADPLSDSLSFVRALAVYAAGWLLLRMEAGPDKAALEAWLLDSIARETSPAVWAAIGRALPALLSGALSDPAGFAATVLGPEEPASREGVVWDAYVRDSSAYGDVVRMLASRYAWAARQDEGPVPEGRLGDPPRLALGVHIVHAALWGSVPGAQAWLADFFAHSTEAVNVRLSRFLADMLGEELRDEQTEYVRRTAGADREGLGEGSRRNWMGLARSLPSRASLPAGGPARDRKGRGDG